MLQNVTRQQNHLYGYTDTCLTNIDEIYIMIGDKKRKLVPGNTVPSKVKGIFIICKVSFPSYNIHKIDLVLIL